MTGLLSPFLYSLPPASSFLDLVAMAALHRRMQVLGKIWHLSLLWSFSGIHGSTVLGNSHHFRKCLFRARLKVGKNRKSRRSALLQSRALPSSPWLGHEREGVRVGQKQGQEQGKNSHGGTKENGPWVDFGTMGATQREGEHKEEASGMPLSTKH